MAQEGLPAREDMIQQLFLRIVWRSCLQTVSSYSEFIKACAKVVPLMTLLKPSSKYSKKLHY